MMDVDAVVARIQRLVRQTAPGGCRALSDECHCLLCETDAIAALVKAQREQIAALKRHLASWDAWFAPTDETWWGT